LNSFLRGFSILKPVASTATVPASKSTSTGNAGGALFSLFVTVALCALGLITLDREPQNVRTTWVIVLALFYGWQGINLSAWFGERLKAQADGFKIQAALLLILAVPVGLNGFWMTGAWGILAVAIFALGARIKLPAARIFAVLAMSLGFGKWLLWDTGFWLFEKHPSEPYILNGYFGAALILGLACIAGYLISKTSTDEPDTSHSILRFSLAGAPAALAFWAGSAEIQRCFGMEALSDFVPGEQLWMSAYWSTFSIVAALLHLALRKSGRVLDGNPLRWAALVAFVMVTVKWFFIDTPAWGMNTVGPFASPAVNLYGLNILLLILAGAAIGLRSTESGDEPSRHTHLRTSLTYCAVITLFWGGTWEIHRCFDQLAAGWGMSPSDVALAEQMSQSLFWSVFAIALIVSGFIFVRAAPRYAGLGLFMLTLVKVGLLDLSFLSAGYRILSFAGLGILLLLTSVLYGYFSPKLLPKSEAVTALT